MSASAPAVIPSATTPNPQFLALQENFAKLDQFAAENSITSLVSGDTGAFVATLRMSQAVGALREMITPEMMKPVMDLQGSALGFRTDKDKEGGYTMAVVKEVLIEATLKGFRMVANETNIIGGRFYAARDGFERIFRDLSKQGKLTDLRLLPSVPRTTAEGSVVAYAASWTFKGIKDELKLEIPVKVNNGQGADAVLGKAKRKMLAAIYSRVTGTEITDGEVDDGKSINVETTTVKETVRPKLPADVLGTLEELLTQHEAQANKFLLDAGCITKGQTFRDVSEKIARDTIKRPAAFFQAAGVKASE
jgi:hypothetical protein